MNQDFDLKLDGESVEIISGELTRTFDTPNDAFSVRIKKADRIKNPSLYQKVKPYQSTPATVYLENKLMLKGTLTKTVNETTISGQTTNLTGFSDTFNFVDSALAPPYEFLNYDLESLCIAVAKQTGTKVVNAALSTSFAGPGGSFSFIDVSGIFDKVTVNPGQSGYDFIAPLAAQRDRIVSNTLEGDLLLQQANINQESVGTLDESNNDLLLTKEYHSEYDLRSRFKTYKVRSQTPSEFSKSGAFSAAGIATAIATDKNIKSPRHKIVAANDQVVGGLQKIAEYTKNTALIAALSQDIPIVGWIAPNGKLFAPGTLITLKSETLFVPDGFTYFIKAVKYIFGGEKSCVLSLIPKEVYSNEPIVEPWFE